MANRRSYFIYDRLGLTLHRNLIYQFPVFPSVNQQHSTQNQELYITLEEEHVMAVILMPCTGCLPEMTMTIALFPALHGGIYSTQKGRYGVETTTLYLLAANFLQRDST